MIDGDRETDVECSSIEVCRRGHRHWSVRDSTGRIGGLFLTHEAALRFAQAECDIHHGAFRLAPLSFSAIEG